VGQWVAYIETDDLVALGFEFDGGNHDIANSVLYRSCAG
jgi:hypothetical protein